MRRPAAPPWKLPCLQQQEKPAANANSILAQPSLLPGLPDDLAIQCLAKVPSLSSLYRVCTAWQRLLSQSHSFYSLRSSLGFPTQKWIYTLLRAPLSSADDDQDQDQRVGSPSFSWHTFDPLFHEWHALPALPQSVDFQLTSPSLIGLTHSVQCVSSSSKLLMVAGSRLSNQHNHLQQRESRNPMLEPALERPLVFDTQTRTWTEGAPFTAPRRWCVCGMASEKLLVASGCGKDWDMALSKSVEMYDVKEQKWERLADLRSSKFSGEAISAVSYGGRLHMASGKGVFWKAGVIYDLRTGSWRDMPGGMTKGWTGPSVVVDGRLLVLEDSSGKLKVYNDEEDEWVVLMEDELLKNMEQLQGACGKVCGIVRGPGQPDRIRIIDVQSPKPSVITEVLPPFGQVVSLQLLAGMIPAHDLCYTTPA